ncbi:hypothetical protein EJ04DRAFT_502111 [Polyplosphaeria fusca]|uniref:Zn(2)-C6 fungal-type domain-containing protein n=1 Tax=Polyplosphaeria fusca TaxID=682080 RepID=A0A9P4UY20_9PLEO|nr:hypothetical protein EJ04DRAFT_502111 [Polyplosphaeria fusca]
MAVPRQPSPKRQCWECLRRRLVCDFGRPGCKKCCNAGKECPGYDEKKPLKWLDPGRVTSKTRTKKKSPKPAPSESTTPSDVEEVGFDVSRLDSLDWRDDTSDVVQSIYYYNNHLYPELLAITELAPNPYILYFPLKALPLLPPSIRHTMVCLSLSYRLHTLPPAAIQGYATVSWSRIFHHRGLAIRSLSEEIGTEGTRTSDKTIAAVLVFMCFELQQPVDYRQHISGLAKLINLRGGLQKLFEVSPHLKPALIFIGVFGNTTSPVADQITVSAPNNLIEVISEQWNLIFPHTLIPQQLFLYIIQINLLRAQTSTTNNYLDPGLLQIEAEELLSQISSFSPELWAGAHPSRQEEWSLIAAVWQSAIIIYCIASLQSLAVLPMSSHFRAIRTAHGDLLFLHLKQALNNWQIRKYMMWPLVVSGFEAVERTMGVQTRVSHQLDSMAQDIGTGSPCKARERLEKFWASGKMTWDECWDAPNAFVC